MFCSKCGIKNNDNANFCSQCGTPLRSFSPNVNMNAPQKKGCCSCTSIFLILAFIPLLILGILTYIIYSGPDSLNKFLAPKEDNLKFLSSFSTSENDALTFEKNILEFEKYISKGDTVELHIKENEINSYLKYKVLVSKNANNPLKDLKLKFTSSGLSFIGIVNIQKIDAYFEILSNIFVEQNEIKFKILSSKLGIIPMPAFALNILIDLFKTYINKKSNNLNPLNQFKLGNTEFKINHILFLNSKMVLECISIKK